MKYFQVVDNKPYIVNLDTPVLEQCCGCGIVHRVVYSLDGTQLSVNVEVVKGAKK